MCAFCFLRSKSCRLSVQMRDIFRHGSVLAIGMAHEPHVLEAYILVN